MPAKSCDQSTVSPDAIEEQIVGVIVYFGEFVRVWFSPAISASEVACIDVRRHLHAAMTLYAVEGSLVARTVVDQALLSPMADLDAAVFADQMVTLFGQSRSQLRLYFRHWCALHLHRLLTSDSTEGLRRGSLAVQSLRLE